VTNVLCNYLSYLGFCHFDRYHRIREINSASNQQEIEISTGTRNALSALESTEIKAIIIDCDDVDGGKEFLSWAARKHAKSAVIVALTNHLTTLHEAFDLGATFVLQKPLNSERVTRCMRASSQLVAPQPQVN
jgi:DNA-binding response OmpR family regulator